MQKRCSKKKESLHRKTQRHLHSTDASLPILPDVSWKPAGDEDPTYRILGLLAFTIGLPYFLVKYGGSTLWGGMVFFLLATLLPRQPIVRLAVLALVLLLALRHAPALNLLLRGDVQAFTQGVDVERTRRTLVLLAAVGDGARARFAGCGVVRPAGGAAVRVRPGRVRPLAGRW